MVTEFFAAVFLTRTQAEHVRRVYGGGPVVEDRQTIGGIEHTIWRITKEAL